MIDHQVEKDHIKNAAMSKFYTLIMSLGICFLSVEEGWAQCPTLFKYEVSYNQVQEGNNGILTFFLKENDKLSQLKLDAFEYNLWDKSRGVYLYSPSKLDAGFHEDKNITISINPSGKIEFRNVPPGNNYCLVISSPDCKSVYGSEEGITVNKSDRKDK